MKAEIVTALAHQVRAIRTQRGWTQSQLAKRLGTTQAAVSRLEDPTYGRVTISTLLELASVFDTGLQVKFVSMLTMLNETFIPNAKAREVASFEEESNHVGFYDGCRISEGSTTFAVSHVSSSQPITVVLPRSALSDHDVSFSVPIAPANTFLQELPA